jgi:hypothetical protein
LTKHIGLMAAEFKKDHSAVLRRYPFFRSTLEQRHRLFGSPLVTRPCRPELSELLHNHPQ